MGEAKARGVDASGYMRRETFSTLGANAWYVGVNAAMRRECTIGGKGATIVAMLAERAALTGCPNVSGTVREAPASTEAHAFALAEAVLAAPDRTIVVLDDATLEITAIPEREFMNGYVRLAGLPGAGRCARTGSSWSASMHASRGTYLAMGADGRHSVVEAAVFLKDKAVSTPAGMVALDDPLSMQIATATRAIALAAAGMGASLGEGWQATLRRPLDAGIAHASMRYAGRSASADLEVASASLRNEANARTLMEIGKVDGMPFHSAMRSMVDGVMAGLPGTGTPEDDYCRHMGSPASRWDRGDLSSVGEASISLGGPSIPADARATTVGESEVARTMAYLEAGRECGAITFEGGARCRFFDLPGGRHAVFDGGDPERRLVAWTSPEDRT